MDKFVGFSRMRSRYSGPINRAAMVGMLGDIAVFGGLYFLYKLNKTKKEANANVVKEKKKQQNL